MTSNGFHVYTGKDKIGNVVYVGTTIQKPSDRWRWHKHNGKDLDFSLVMSFENADDMLYFEKKLIDEIKPRLNKITHRKQNFNKKLTQEQLSGRVDDSEWCQCCLKRRVSIGYKKCRYC